MRIQFRILRRNPTKVLSTWSLFLRNRMLNVSGRCNKVTLTNLYPPIKPFPVLQFLYPCFTQHFWFCVAGRFRSRILFLNILLQFALEGKIEKAKAGHDFIHPSFGNAFWVYVVYFLFRPYSSCFHIAFRAKKMNSLKLLAVLLLKRNLLLFTFAIYEVVGEEGVLKFWEMLSFRFWSSFVRFKI